MATLDKNNYKSVPAIGQFDRMACWAACLAWWLKAVKDGRPSWTQSQVISEYDKHTEADGGFNPQTLIDVFKNDSRLKISAGVFKTSQYRGRGLPLGDKPVMIAYNHPQAGTHMNVLFGQVNRDVIAMEPYHPYPGKDGQRTGIFVDRNVDFFIKNSPNIILAWPTVTFGS
ncbi:MAG: hypothetical protein KF889_11620 [Alphaproteobacteria bacterium]|nr:hypothetical protein [Alphaproteobacteria bacterium]MCW5739361.1 hypothetical protein [Alphaproteobacteria bacterium]